VGVQRWLVLVVTVAVVVGLVAFARGREHHRGDETGALGPAVAVSLVLPG
jgi:hypothetical protein